MNILWERLRIRVERNPRRWAIEFFGELTVLDHELEGKEMTAEYVEDWVRALVYGPEDLEEFVN
jgi:hypothetical protein